MLNATQGFTYNKFEKPNDWPKIDKTFDYKIENGKLLSGNEHIYLSGPVTYTKVGNPTIEDGIASGFSSSDYLSISTTPNFSQDTEIVSKIKITASDISQYIIGWSNDGAYQGGIRLLDNRKLNCLFQRNADGTNNRYIDGTKVYDENTEYWIKLIKNNNSLALFWSIDGSTWTQDGSTSTYENMPSFTVSNLRIGISGAYTPSASFNSSIDLNETYIKVNDQLWFYGKNYTTKNMVPVPTGLEYNNTTIPSIGWVNTNTDRVKGPVNYTVVGSPTIADGVASGFSGSDYLTTIFRPGANPWEIVIKFKTPSSFGSWQALAAKQGSVRFSTQLTNLGRIQTVIVTSSAGTKTINGNILQTNTDYWLKLVFDGSAYTQYISTDGINYSVDGTPQETTSAMSDSSDPLLFGVGRQLTNILQSSIDLNQTYIKVNGQPWFGFAPSEFQEFTPAPKGTMIGKDDTHSLAVETYQDKGTVDYTVVGSPTIVDGVASGFSSSDYLQTSSAMQFGSNYEMVIKINTPSTIPTSYTISNGFVYLFSSSGGLKYSFYDAATSSWKEGALFNFSTNTNYYIKEVFDGSSLSILRSYDGKNYTSIYSYATTSIGYGSSAKTFVFGYASNRYWTGSIDLNETYIKVNGQYWFHPYPNSYPKLVGPVDYTVVGSPTIVNGIASGFSVNDYLTIDNFNNLSFFEFCISFKIGENVPSDEYIVSSYASSSGNLFIRLIGDKIRINYGSSAFYSNTLFQVGSAATIKIIAENGALSLYVYQNGRWILDNSTTVTIISNFGALRLGASAGTASEVFKGSIDLNETYIKVNGKLWFGKEDWTPSTYTDNAIYLLGSHSTDYSSYNTQGINPTIETESDESGTYNVWIDNQEIYKEQSNPLDVNWNNLALSTGYNITTPSTLKAHVIKVEPNNGNITRFSADTNYKVEDGKLTWANPNIYLQSDGNSYINTGISQHSRWTFECQAPDNLNGGLLLARSGSGANWFATSHQGQVRYWAIGNISGQYSSFSKSTKVKVDVTFKSSGSAAIINGENFSRSDAVSDTVNFGLFADSLGNYKFVATLFGNIKCYDLNGELLRDFVSVPQGLQIGSYTVPSNGMFDLVTQTFFGNQGTGSFTIGKDS